MSLNDVTTRIRAAEAKTGLSDGQTKLIAVSKVQPLERVEAVLEQGHRIFGENKMQEAAGKWPEFSKRYDGIELHLLGPLQSNKTKQAMELFDVIHTLDRSKLARKLATLRGELGKCPELFIQINTGQEDQKAGVMPEDADAFIAECRDLDLPLTGLMCIPPADEDPAPHFAMLADIAKRNDLQNLSMGMSGDFETAIAHGATHVRVGSAIFGEREY